jgi:hypothetical protein
MRKKIFKRATPGQIMVLVFLLGLLVFFLKDAGFTTILIVVATAVIAGLVLLPWSNVKGYDEEDLIDWDLVNYPSDKDD